MEKTNSDILEKLDARRIPYFGDVPLKSAMIAWNSLHDGYFGIPGRVMVIPWPDRGCCDFFKLANTVGACSGWRGMGSFTGKRLNESQMLLQLYIEAWHIVCRDGVNPEAMHSALMAIPEYRETLSGERFFSLNKL
jgi:hypothetical protein